MIIRPEVPEDIPKIREINIEAFDTEAEADLVDALRKSGIPLISLVAEDNDRLVGHILFSPVSLQCDRPDISIAGLAPMAVILKYQRKGIGSMLVQEGLKRCRESGYAAVVVLGYPEYYPRFGFVPAVRYGIKSEYEVPDEVFMVKELEPGDLNGCQGIVRYHEAFSRLK